MQNSQGGEGGSHSQNQRQVSRPPHQQQQPQVAVIALNDRLYNNARAVFEQRGPQLLQKYQSSMVDEIIRHTQISGQTTYNIQKQTQSAQGNAGTYFFQGYPSGNYLKQICVILSLWKQMQKFPIEFKPLSCLAIHDDTEKHIETLNKCTHLVTEIFVELSQNGTSPRNLQKSLLELFLALEPHGFLMCLGVRRTIGSQEFTVPPDRKNLISSFTQLNSSPSEDRSNPSILTVGARAMQKHSG